ncbi:MAG: family 10 glycosylhydrolase [Candidatus Omnitrophica bacterium]|nr:family 10 glycosylhydrolase [Candidatus Omnitrophota bacterium]
MFELQVTAHCEDAIRYGLLVTVLQDPVTLGSRTEIEKLTKFAKVNQVDTIFIQIYRANKAYFPSKVGDSAPYMACVKSVGEDPLALLIKKAHASGIKVYAWLNMMSLGENKNAVILKKYGPGILTCGPAPKKYIEDYKTDGQYFLEPGDLRVRKELVDMTGDIVAAYPALDGLLFDYIRYPDKDPPYGYTASNISRFKKTCNHKFVQESDTDWKEWKRRQVTETLEAVVNKARSVRRGMRISATACAPYARAYHEAFQDWPGWIEKGVVDYIALMSYPPCARLLKKYVREAKEKTPDFRKINIAVPAYKLVNSPGVFNEQLAFCRNSKPNMCMIFDYESLLKNDALIKALAEVNK